MHWEEMGTRSLMIPLDDIDSDVISFTFTDSFYTFSPTTLQGIPIPDKPHRRTVYRKDELLPRIIEFGPPPGYSNPDELFDVYIEAQIWDDAFLHRLAIPPAKAGTPPETGTPRPD